MKVLQLNIFDHQDLCPQMPVNSWVPGNNGCSLALKPCCISSTSYRVLGNSCRYNTPFTWVRRSNSPGRSP
jgi:hypothetical protein